ncbi:hypothetical protein G7Y89_g4528 [Cudoniella acicularis]|uniref:DNA replication checkpoint mediator MRC1 domain-containing protein n=1 Tax=Cudoniella acicularis TaxID=354080 RepID=A0A8H4RQ33_9HELO|nr:hypothetical protein G7Y89_g4528 [Cudoniella acicularis]
MASSREASPTHSNPSSPTQLTPTSKVRALLANFDDDSDEESNVGFARTNLNTAFTKSASSNPEHDQPEQDEINNKATVKAADVDEDEDEEDIVRPASRPLGRMAARMLAADRAKLAAGKDEAGEDARARVRNMLLPKKSSPEPIVEKEVSQDSEDSDAPVISRKRKIRSRHDTPNSSPAKDAGSPGLFVSPSAQKTTTAGNQDSDSDLPEHPSNNDRFLALVKQKREERLAREAEAAKEKTKKLADQKRHAKILEEDEDDISDEDAGRRLTQPSRQASKKAQEEIRRETQRMSRNQQLAYKPTTKKKYAKADFFAKFNFRQESKSEVSSPARPASSSSAAPHSDFEMKDTPPTSPASPANLEKSLQSGELPAANTEVQNADEEDLPSLEKALTRIPLSPPKRLDKGKGKAVEERPSEPETLKKKSVFTQRPIKIRPPKVANRKATGLDDSDSDLEIVSVKTPNAKQKKLDSIFDRVPAKQAKESHSLHALRMLAHVTSPGKQKTGKNKKQSMTTGELQLSLQQRARQQATREREERLQALRDRGIIVQTSEEREKEMAEVEDLIAKARREGEAIMQREKAAAKKERKENREVDPLGESSDDEDWQEEKEAEAELSVSGSDDEENEESEDEEGDASGEEELEGQKSAAPNPMFDNEAEETEDDEAEADLSIDEELAEDGDVDEDLDEDEQRLPTNQKQRRNRKAVISDDEDEEADQSTPVVTHTKSPLAVYTDSPGAPNSVLRSATKTFIPGLTIAGPAGLGLTQIFAGTMDDSQLDDDTSPTQPSVESPQMERGQNSLAFLRRLPAPELLPFVPTMEEDTQDQDVVMDSQSAFNDVPETQGIDSVSQQIQLQFSQSQMHGFDSLVDDEQCSPFPQATQDAGFKHMTPIRGRFVEPPPSTVGTVILPANAVPETLDETPIVKKKGRLHRRSHVAAFSDEEDAGEPMEVVPEEDEFDITANAFEVMRKASKKKVIVGEFDKKNSKAKDMVHEQAEESEDEYAGLGGASDDESGGEEDALVKEMIDDEGGKDVDESKLAAFFADRERASDEKQIEKLYNDISKGMLRRKRGEDYDLSDSDDGGEARQRRKRAEFAKMRKALLADERIGKIAENPKRQAFLRAIEDRHSEDEMDFLNDFAEQEETTDSQSQSQGESLQQVIPDSQPVGSASPKRKRFNEASEAEKRPPPHLRRTKNGKKPTNLTEIRESLSSLIEEPNSAATTVESGSESDDELEIEGEHNYQKEKENRDPFAFRRTKVPVIDRISLKRASASSLSTNTRLAFAASSSASGFKVPPLLRRATTNNSLASSTSSSVTGGMSATERTAGSSGSDGVKRGGGKNSGVNYFARETERRAAVVKTEKRREQKRFKGAEVRRKVVGGLFGSGKFE